MKRPDKDKRPFCTAGDLLAALILLALVVLFVAVVILSFLLSGGPVRPPLLPWM